MMIEKLFCGNNIELLKSLDANSIDAIVTDPPYGLGKEQDTEAVLRSWLDVGHHDIKGSGFMGKDWDAYVPQPAFWKEAIRVLKPGGHVLAFYGTRTYDLGVMAMRLAGFEIRDCLAWVYGSGFPKMHNVSKAIDKKLGAEREVVGEMAYKSRRKNENSGMYGSSLANPNGKETAPATEPAKKYDGWDVSLKPAFEPIVLARKPLEKGLTVAQNVLKWGTGGINIGACRVGFGAKKEDTLRNMYPSKGWCIGSHKSGSIDLSAKSGRYPANLVHDGSDEVLGVFPVRPESGGGRKGEIGKRSYLKTDKARGVYAGGTHGLGMSGKVEYDENGNAFVYTPTKLDGGGSAARFFYCAKTSPSERNAGLDGFETKQTLGGGGMTAVGDAYGSIKAKAKNHHPTVKPIRLMQWLIRLVTPEGGTVLDPFMGSGTTGCAAALEDTVGAFIGMELQADYFEIAKARISYFKKDGKAFMDKQRKKELLPESKGGKSEKAIPDLFNN